MWERRWCSCIKQRRWKMVRSTRETQIILTPVRPGFNPHRISVLGRNTGEIKKNFSCHLFSISLNILNWRTILFFLNRSGQWWVSWLPAANLCVCNFPYIRTICECVGQTGPRSLTFSHARVSGCWLLLRPAQENKKTVCMYHIYIKTITYKVNNSLLYNSKVSAIASPHSLEIVSLLNRSEDNVNLGALVAYSG